MRAGLALAFQMPLLLHTSPGSMPRVPTRLARLIEVPAAVRQRARHASCDVQQEQLQAAGRDGERGMHPRVAG